MATEQRKTSTLRVVFHVDVDNVRDAEKLLLAWIAPREDDDRLISFEIFDRWTNPA